MCLAEILAFLSDNPGRICFRMTRSSGDRWPLFSIPIENVGEPLLNLNSYDLAHHIGLADDCVWLVLS